MKNVAGVIIHIFFVLFCFESYANSAENRELRRYCLEFSDHIKNCPKQIFLKNEKIGVVDTDDGYVGGLHRLKISIYSTHSDEFEVGTICYVSSDKIIVYNVWSNGVKLMEGGAVKGFKNGFWLHLHEVKMLLAAVLDSVIELFLWVVNRFGVAT